MCTVKFVGIIGKKIGHHRYLVNGQEVLARTTCDAILIYLRMRS